MVTTILNEQMRSCICIKTKTQLRIKIRLRALAAKNILKRKETCDLKNLKTKLRNLWSSTRLGSNVKIWT